MNARRVWMILGIGMGLFLVGGLGGVAFDRMQFERGRAAMLADYEAGTRAWEAARATAVVGGGPAVHPGRGAPDGHLGR
jgi:hypothetical protein